MKNIVVVGTQWGDEGKGKIVDFLSEEADVIVRFQGGHNAGHTLVIDGTTYKLSILPSGIIREDKISIIGNGVVLNPWSLLDEIQKLKNLGIFISNKNLKISRSAPLILPIHSLVDNSREIQRGKSKIGTTAAQKKLFFNLKKIKSKISALDEGDLTPEQVDKISTELSVPKKEVISMNRRISGSDYSLNAPVTKDGEGEWQDWLEDETQNQEATFADTEEYLLKKNIVENY